MKDLIMTLLQVGLCIGSAISADKGIVPLAVVLGIGAIMTFIAECADRIIEEIRASKTGITPPA
jgi:hypothetical protein